MVDSERRKFLKMGLKLITFSGTLAATYPLQSIYAGKVRPSLIESFPKEEIPKKIDFSLMDSVVPQILASSAIMTFVMMHSDFLQAMLFIFLSAIALVILGIPLAEFSFNYFF
jgi:hypothetical protein|tara:strand:+ start:171 stop:509 length:339 start_codon:yes stop_codon:yes gene_type:complete